MNPILGELIEFKVDAVDAMGPKKTKKVMKKATKTIRELKLTPEQTKAFLNWLRGVLRIQKKSKTVFKPRPIQTKIKTAKKLTNIGFVRGDIIDQDFDTSTPYKLERVRPTKDLAFSGEDIYPYIPPPEATDVPGEPLDGLGNVYPYDPPNVPGTVLPAQLDNLGTLLPPRPLEHPWRTAVQKIFRPGDYVISKVDHSVGQIRAIRGEEVLVAYGKRKYLRVPMQDLAPYYGTVRELKKAERNETVNLTKMVGRNPTRP